MNRRQFLATASSLAVTTTLSAAEQSLFVSSNVYSWLTFYGREGKNLNANLKAFLDEYAQCELNGIEPLIDQPEQLEAYRPLLQERKITMPSLYTNSKLHDSDAAASIKQVLAIARKAGEMGCRIVVTNPSPLKWGGPDHKNDDQLKRQAESLNRLGEELRKLGQTLAYHNHDMEMRQSAREFHHMMLGTDPQYVSLCLDAHWIFRGAGDSQIALFDIVKLYARRVVELHLRQSAKGVWTEQFGPGDIDYPRLSQLLQAERITPLITLEQAVEGKTPNTLKAVEAHQQGRKYASEVFASLKPR